MTAITEKQRSYTLEVLPHIDALSSFALRLTGDREEANDLLQETCLKAFRFFDGFEPGSNAKAWLFRIMKNSFVNRYRSAQKRPRSIDFAGVQESYRVHPDGRLGGDGGVPGTYDGLLSDEVATAVEALPPDFRTVVILSDLEELSYDEIARFVDCPVGTVRSRLHRGRRLLRRSLWRYAEGKGVGSRE
jgi:RNA polymerase sigma-70 factor (ECF subfamily)